MSRKRRSRPRDRDGSKDQPTQAESAGAESPGAESPAGSDSPDDSDPQRAPRVELPAFGLASEILGSDLPRRPVSSSEPAAENDAPGETDESERALDQAMLAAAAAEIDAEGPGRIFEFADRVAASAWTEDAPKAPQRLETWMTFALAGETFAMPVEPVLQVVRVGGITRVPHAPRPIRGVMNLRGRVIPLIDLRLRVGLSETALDRSARVVAVASHGRVLGLLVDAVYQVTRIDVDRIQPPPEDVMTMQSDYILGVYHQNDRLILLLDVDRALVVRDAEVGAA